MERDFFLLLYRLVYFVDVIVYLAVFGFNTVCDDHAPLQLARLEVAGEM